MKDFSELSTMIITHLRDIYLGKTAQCLYIQETFATLQLRYKEQ